MSARFEAIGFSDGDAALHEQADRLSRRARRSGVGLSGVYFRWSDPSGAQLWVQKTQLGRLIGVSPHFAGEGRIRARLTRFIERGDGTKLDGAFYGWAGADASDTMAGQHPFVFDAPDALVHGQARLPRTVDVQVAAFALEIEAFESEEDYYESVESGDIAFAARSFIPTGLFQPDGDAIEPPEAFCTLAGIVLDAARRTNGETGAPFQWALVDTAGGIVDVVAPPDALSDVPPPGGVIQGSFWLSGVIQE